MTTTVATKTEAPKTCSAVQGAVEQLSATSDECNKVCSSSVRELAYSLWEQAGCPTGDGSEFWYLAERELSQN